MQINVNLTCSTALRRLSLKRVPLRREAKQRWRSTRRTTILENMCPGPLHRHVHHEIPNAGHIDEACELSLFSKAGQSFQQPVMYDTSAHQAGSPRLNEFECPAFLQAPYHQSRSSRLTSPDREANVWLRARTCPPRQVRSVHTINTSR